jgi:hypothetical protein
VAVKAPRESHLVRACLQLLAAWRIPAWRQNQGALKVGGRFVRFAGVNGISDILGVLPPSGRMLAVECKTPRGRLAADQAAFLDAVREAGGLSLVVRGVDELHRALRREVGRL